MEDKVKEYPELAAMLAERAAGDVGLIITGGLSPNLAGMVSPMAGRMSSKSHVERHSLVTKAVHKEGGLIAMQILHAGRYGYHPLVVAPSRIKSPISPFTPRGLTGFGVRKQIRDYVNSAKLAQEAGYDGVEIMGSEGYLISTFVSPATNKRTDEYGGSFENRIRFPLEIVRQTREAVGKDFIIVYRLSLIDLVQGGCTWEEVETLAQGVEAAGASIINSGVGWHESRVPTIATLVPRAAFSWTTAKLKKSGKISIPICATNRINTPELAESILENGEADLISMARPFLADENFMKKVKENRTHLINVCIGCNQACLDHTFTMRRSTCLVNPRAGYETKLNYVPLASPDQAKKIGVVGGGPAGMAVASVAAERGHQVTLFEASDRLGGQFNFAKVVPGKEEFQSTLTYYQNLLKETKANVKLSTKAQVDDLTDFDEVVIATGVSPRIPDVPGLKDCGIAVTYDEILSGKVKAGKRVAIMGAGGIGFDIATFLGHEEQSGKMPEIEQFNKTWGVTKDGSVRGGVVKADFEPAHRELYLMQRKKEKMGKNLAKTTGWIHRMALKNEGVHMMNGVTYKSASKDGMVIEVDGKEQKLDVDTIVVCAGQNPMRELADSFKSKTGRAVHLIGGAFEAKELDAKHAIKMGSELGAKL
jgi:2,4-dienoyl-CoA reductase (NADPH2)